MADQKPATVNTSGAGAAAGAAVAGVVGGAVDGVVDAAPHVAKAVGTAGKAVVSGAAGAGHAMLHGAVDLVNSDELGRIGTHVGKGITEGGKAVGAGAAALWEKRGTIVDGAAYGANKVADAGVGTARCCGCIAIATWNNTYNCIRPFCSHCGASLSGGCGKRWPAYTRPGCEHLICPTCYENVSDLPPCLKCEIKKKAIEKAKQREETCCLGFIPWKSKKAPKAEGPDYHIGHLSTRDVMEKVLPNLARQIADAKGLDTDELLNLMKNDDSKALLKSLAQATSIPVELR